METSDIYDNKALQLNVEKWGDILSRENPQFTKKEIDDLLIGSKLFLVIEAIHSNYMRVTRLMWVFANGESESMTTKSEWRRE